MFYFRIVSFYLLVVNVLGYTAPYYNLEEAEQLFADFITKYERKYESPEEYSRRFEIFKAKLKKINELNDRNTDKRGGYEITRFADQDGFKSCVDTSKRPNSTRIVQVKREFIVNAPDHLDYRDQNLVTEVKNQGECRDCYVFAAIASYLRPDRFDVEPNAPGAGKQWAHWHHTFSNLIEEMPADGNIEGMHAKATQNIISLSEQQALDCVSTGCDVGGQEIDAINALVSQGGSMSEQDYPYTATKGTCNTDKSKIQVKVLGGNRMPTPDVETLKGALYQNGAPLAINLYAPDSISGVTGFKILNPDDCNGQSINHAVLLVGYNKDATTGKSYWIIKNSWGTERGDNGYFYFDMECRCSIGADGATTAQVE